MATETILQGPAVVRPSDDEILGITSSSARKPGRIPAGKVTEGNRRGESADPFAELAEADGAAGDRADLSDADAGDAVADGASGDSAELSAILETKPELRDAWNDAKEYREAFATPAEARAATKLLGDLNRMDALFYSKRPEDQVELARAVAQLDPQAFASLARAMTELGNGATANGRIAAASPDRGAARTSATRTDAAWVAEAPAASTIAGLTPAQSDFFHATNAQAVQGVMEAIETQVERLLPEGISKAARNRVAGEIYREMDTTLQGNRALGQQMREAFQVWGAG